MPFRAYTAILIPLALTLPAVVSAEDAATGGEENDGPGRSRPHDDREWVEMGHGIRFGVGINRIDVSHGDPPLIYVGTNVGYIYRSADGGATWDETRILPDDRPLLNVPLINPMVMPFPNEGLVDQFNMSAPAGTYRWPDMGPTNLSFGPEAMRPDGTIGFTGMHLMRPGRQEASRANAFALVGSGARVETEDPGNLMASFFSGVASQPGFVNYISICRSDPTIAFVGTNFGAFRTRDMGITWDRVFIGTSREENTVAGVQCHPENSDIVILSTHAGLRISRNGGEQFHQPSGRLGSWASYFVSAHPVDPRRLLVGTSFGGWETVTGEEAEMLYLEDTPSPQVRNVNVIRATTDENIWYVGTRDGASYSHDGGETWRRVSEFLLGHFRIRQIQVDPRDPMHAYFLTDYHLFETHDGGQSLEQILWGYTTLKHVLIEPSDPDTLWLAGYSQVWKYTHPRAVSGPLSPAARRARRALRRDPGHYEIIDRTLEQARLDPPTIQQTQRRMRLSSLVPTLNIYFQFLINDTELNVTGVGRVTRHSWYTAARCWSHVGIAWCPGTIRMDEVVQDRLFEPIYAGFIMLSWPFGRAIQDERRTGRMWRDIFSMQNRIMYNIYDYWADRRRLLEYLARGTATRAEERAYLLRLEEMSAVIDAMTDGAVGGPFGESEGRGLNP